MTDTPDQLMQAALLFLAVAFVGMAALVMVLAHKLERRSEPEPVDPEPFPYTGEPVVPWVSDCYRRPRRGTWRQDCTS